MTDSEQQRKTIAKVLKIVGGIILAVSIVGLAGLIASNWMDISYNFHWAKLLFACGLGLFETGRFLSKMGPYMSKPDRKSMIIGISMLLCCSAISVFLLITGLTSRTIVPLTIGLLGDLIGDRDLFGNKDKETTGSTTVDNETK